MDKVEILPVTPERWEDLRQLFDTNSICRGCYCMYFRQTRALSQASYGVKNREAMKMIVDSGEVPGLLAYLAGHPGNACRGQPVGWVSVAPRQAFPSLSRSRVCKPVDEQPVWSIVCFFVAKGFRHQGLTLILIQAAVNYAAQQGAKIVEGYPVEPHEHQAAALAPGRQRSILNRPGDEAFKVGLVKVGKMADEWAYVGLASTFRQAGFVEAARRSEKRPLMRFFIQK